jgi:hypothetical protein
MSSPLDSERLAPFSSAIETVAALNRLWQQSAAFWGGVALSGWTLCFTLQRPRADALITLGETIERYVRSSAFLDWLEWSQTWSQPTWPGLTKFLPARRLR